MMTILFAFLYVLLVIFIVGLIVLVGLGIYEYKEYIKALEENDITSEDPPLIKK
jgi:predicted ABC-type exoprotein transport system permease subunit